MADTAKNMVEENSDRRREFDFYLDGDLVHFECELGDGYGVKWFRAYLTDADNCVELKSRELREPVFCHVILTGLLKRG